MYYYRKKKFRPPPYQTYKPKYQEKPIAESENTTNYAFGYPDQSIFLPIEIAWKTFNSFSGKYKSPLKISRNNVHFDQNYLICDIKFNDRDNEDNLLEQNPKFLYNIRRGLTFTVFAKDESQPTIIRKGLQKFFDLEPATLDGPLKLPSSNNLTNYLYFPLVQHFNTGSKIEVFLTRKANGENAQISYSPIFDSWVIASKNVSLLARTFADLKFYKGDPKTNRYSYALEIAETWFKILEKMLLTNKIEQIQEYFADKTFVGEYVGNQNHQHLIRYSTATILFYAIVDNNSHENCQDPVKSAEIFRILGLDSVPMKKCGIYSNIDDMRKCLLQEYINISESKIDIEEEGVVVYLVRRGKSHDEHDHGVSLCKLKTLEYRLYRKLREGLKNLISENLCIFWFMK